MIVVDPETPGGTRDKGREVEEGTMMKGVPFMVVVLKGPLVGAGTVVEPGISKNGVPLTVVVEPTSPEGARDNGMEVADGMTRKGVPFIVVVANGPVVIAGAGT